MESSTSHNISLSSASSFLRFVQLNNLKQTISAYKQKALWRRYKNNENSSSSTATNAKATTLFKACLHHQGGNDMRQQLLDENSGVMTSSVNACEDSDTSSTHHAKLNGLSAPSSPIEIVERRNKNTVRLSARPASETVPEGDNVALKRVHIQLSESVNDTSSSASYKESPIFTIDLPNKRRFSCDATSDEDCIHVRLSPLHERVPNSNTNVLWGMQEVREIVLERQRGERFGMQMEMRENRLFLTTILRSSRAYKAGLKVGDEIIALNGQPIHRLDLVKITEIIHASNRLIRMSIRPRCVGYRIKEVTIQKQAGLLGIRLQYRNGAIVVDTVIADSPAAQVDQLHEGDELLQIDDMLVSPDWTQEQATEKLKNVKNQESVKLLLREKITLPMDCGQRDKPRGSCHFPNSNLFNMNTCFPSEQFFHSAPSSPSTRNNVNQFLRETKLSLTSDKEHIRHSVSSPKHQVSYV